MNRLYKLSLIKRKISLHKNNQACHYCLYFMFRSVVDRVLVCQIMAGLNLVEGVLGHQMMAALSSSIIVIHDYLKYLLKIPMKIPIIIL